MTEVDAGIKSESDLDGVLTVQTVHKGSDGIIHAAILTEAGTFF